MDIDLLHTERLDELTENLKIIQSDEVFSFSMDAVLLANFANIPLSGKIIDLCSGNGVIPLLISTRTKAEIYGVEIQERLVDMAQRSTKLNNLSHRIHFLQGDLKDSPDRLGRGKFDAVLVNPPYLPLTGQDKNTNHHLAIARHELRTNLEEVIEASRQLLKVGGRLSMVHRPFRLVDIITLLREAKLEPKRIRFVHPFKHKEANMVLVEAIKHGGKEIHVLPPLIVYEQVGKYTDEVYQIYYGKE
ncbi:hypothetical protein BHF71_05075 [Vulcanibacillus modesticaldus]|uniref:Methyltransferase small domain-containing protein n=1 Tax=Vulcanibacillus modesticaldus TaxID=337097 RepID=A0A1D2YX32_9BACI|nr:tRNA1(Val) (adenine(37)-N6)-methyltransferase [Vulcanibacillus modesticaldus]OEG00279.1 hypothetical protein BHF71_05075 [Vulcanibacillus modesticaldus]